MIDFRSGTWETALSPPPKTTPQDGSPPCPAECVFMVGIEMQECGEYGYGQYILGEYTDDVRCDTP